MPGSGPSPSSDWQFRACSSSESSGERTRPQQTSLYKPLDRFPPQHLDNLQHTRTAKSLQNLGRRMLFAKPGDVQSMPEEFSDRNRQATRSALLLPIPVQRPFGVVYTARIYLNRYALASNGLMRNRRPVGTYSNTWHPGPGTGIEYNRRSIDCARYDKLLGCDATPVAPIASRCTAPPRTGSALRYKPRTECPR